MRSGVQEQTRGREGERETARMSYCQKAYLDFPKLHALIPRVVLKEKEMSRNEGQEIKAQQPCKGRGEEMKIWVTTLRMTQFPIVCKGQIVIEKRRDERLPEGASYHAIFNTFRKEK